MAKVTMQTARTDAAEPKAVADALLSSISGTPKLLVLFASRERDQRALNKAIRERLPQGAHLFGCTSGGEIDRGGMYHGQVVLGALSGDLEVGVGLGKGLSEDAMSAGATAMTNAARQLGTTPGALDPSRHVGMVIDDGFKWKKEELLLGALEANPDLALVGGGANDITLDMTKASAEVHADGEVAGDAVAVALVKTTAPFAALRTHWYEPTGKTLTITKIDDSHKRAIEIDGKPAAMRYAELLGVGVDELEFGKPRGFAVHPTATKVGREYFLKSPWMPLPDGSIAFPTLLEAGKPLELMKLGDPIGSTRRFFEELPQKVQNPQAAVLFHCGARAIFAEAIGKAGELSKTFAAAPTCVGYNVFFEIYRGFAINTTLTTLVFGEG
jgi:hypothetical protein